MLLNSIESIIDLFPDRTKILFALVLISIGYLLIKSAKSHKSSLGGMVNFTSSRSKQANKFKIIESVFGYVLIFGAIIFLFSGYQLPTGSDEFSESENETEEEFTSKGDIESNDNFPIISIPKKCIPSKFHEHENYTLIAGDFDNEVNARKRTNTMNYLNIRNQGHFTFRCNPEDIYGIEGKYLLFVGRNFTSLNSAKNKKKKYEDIFRNNEYWTNLRIVKFED